MLKQKNRLIILSATIILYMVIGIFGGVREVNAAIDIPKDLDVPKNVDKPGWEDVKLKDDFVEIYKEQGNNYDVPWELLAAIHRVETTFGGDGTEDISVAGAVGPMQFMPCTWVGWNHSSCSGLGKGNISEKEIVSLDSIKKYKGEGKDGNEDGKADPRNIHDAIAASASYMSKNGANNDGDMEGIKKSIGTYNHSLDYVKKVLYFMRSFGYDIDNGEKRDDNGEASADKGKKKDKKKDKKEDDGETTLYAKGSEEFKSRDYADSALGVKNTNNFIGGDLFLVIQNSSNNIMKVLMYVGVFLVGLLLLFTSTSVVSYMVLANVGGSSGAIGKFEKYTGTTMSRSRETTIKLLGRWLVVVIVITIFLTGLYAPIMTGILSFLESITNYIFGLGG